MQQCLGCWCPIRPKLSSCESVFTLYLSKLVQSSFPEELPKNSKNGSYMITPHPPKQLHNNPHTHNTVNESVVGPMKVKVKALKPVAFLSYHRKKMF